MNIKKLIIENFRGYHKRTEIDFNDLTVFVGKNDAGKSSILEALDIFFENSKPDANDRSIHATGNVKIGVVFSDIPDDFLIDTKVKTSLKDEYLLNKDGYLEINKEFKTKTEISLKVLTPNIPLVSNLINQTNDELKKIAEQIGADTSQIDKRVNSELRLAIRKAVSVEDPNLSEQIIKLDTENEAKDVWKKIQSQLPFYALFKADRATSDKDKEVQDPMKLATKQILKQLELELEPIKQKVKTYVTSLADKTIQKLNDMDNTIASTLETIFEETKWEKAFDIRLESDKIPLDKKGSGLRRLVLINFFRAEADRKMSEKKLPNVIYAIEEPETSQHPDWQIKLIDALKELADLDNTQVLLTTHSPSLAGMINPEDIRFVKKAGKDIFVDSGNITNINEIAKTLGILPDIADAVKKVKLLICVEGPTDVKALKCLCNALRQKHAHLPDLYSEPRIAFIPLGGANLKHWVEEQFLKGLGIPEFHVYDNDVKVYSKHIETVNNRIDGSWGTLTKKYEIESYLHTDAIHKAFEVNVQVTDFPDNGRATPAIFAEEYSRLKKFDGKMKDETAKRYLADKAFPLLTIDMIEERDTENEVLSWFEKINTMISN